MFDLNGVGFVFSYIPWTAGSGGGFTSIGMMHGQSFGVWRNLVQALEWQDSLNHPNTLRINTISETYYSSRNFTEKHIMSTGLLSLVSV